MSVIHAHISMKKDNNNPTNQRNEEIFNLARGKKTKANKINKSEAGKEKHFYVILLDGFIYIVNPMLDLGQAKDTILPYENNLLPPRKKSPISDCRVY